MRVAITGGTGFIGAALTQHLRDRGDEVLVLTRRATARQGELRWAPDRPLPPLRELEGLDAVVNLAGAPIATRPWTQRRRGILRASRLQVTEHLLGALSELRAPPRAFVGISGLWRYGDRGDDVLTEVDDRVAGGFLAQLAVDWEDTQLQAERLGARVAVLRLAMVLGAQGGVLPLMIKPFQVGIGGWLGDGTQYIPWISLRDTVRALVLLLDEPSATGVFNGTAPAPCTNKTFFSALGAALGQSVSLQAPSWVLRGAFGCMAEELLLASTRAAPEALLNAGFTFRDGEIRGTMRGLLDQHSGGQPAF
ncbi:MAG: TIGR01777 family oxidoreductase [Deltaproteobacteria bacterium]|nr:TIGR01777 family oxidoreductase [Deltaproteobacteria bacterium]